MSNLLTKAVSIEDYNRFQKYTNDAYTEGIIEEPSVLQFSRYIVTYPFKELGM